MSAFHTWDTCPDLDRCRESSCLHDWAACPDPENCGAWHREADVLLSVSHEDVRQGVAHDMTGSEILEAALERAII
jgi:hypothetical protein